MRLYIIKYLTGTGAAAVMVALCVGWLVYDGVAQVDAAVDNDILTVGQCIDASAAVDHVEEALIKEDIIGEDLLQTKVTNGMCKDMLERIPDGTPPLRTLVAAHSYIQAIRLIEGAMHEAVGEAAARGTERYSSSDVSLILFRAIAQTSEQLPAQAQYDGTGGGGTGGVEPTKRQAAAAARVGEDNDASIRERLRQKEEAAEAAGASISEARASARCSTEVEVADEEVKNPSGWYQLRPGMPKEMRPNKPKQANLLVLPLTKKKFQEIRQQEYEDIAKVSKSDIGCVVLTDRMKAVLVGQELGIRDLQQDDIRKLSSNQHTIWHWSMIANQIGKQQLSLYLGYDISGSPEDPEFRYMPKDGPVYAGPVRVTPPESDSSLPGRDRQWLWRVVVGFVLTAVIASVTLFFLWRRNIQGYRSN
jgi:hypothetical protein